jgi:hypothetical protein
MSGSSSPTFQPGARVSVNGTLKIVVANSVDSGALGDGAAPGDSAVVGDGALVATLLVGVALVPTAWHAPATATTAMTSARDLGAIGRRERFDMESSRDD